MKKEFTFIKHFLSFCLIICLIFSWNISNYSTVEAASKASYKITTKHKTALGEI